MNNSVCVDRGEGSGESDAVVHALSVTCFETRVGGCGMQLRVHFQ